MHALLYENFELFNPFISVKLIVWALFAGFVAAALLAVYNKRLIGGLVKKMLFENCTSPEKAMTVTELGYGTDWFVKNALRTDAALLRFVRRIDLKKEDDEKAEKEDARPEKTRGGHDVIDFSTARFYIPEELKYKADVRYASRGTDFVSFGICIVIFIAAAFAAIFIIPDLIQLIDNFIGSFRA